MTQGRYESSAQAYRHRVRKRRGLLTAGVLTLFAAVASLPSAGAQVGGQAELATATTELATATINSSEALTRRVEPRDAQATVELIASADTARLAHLEEAFESLASRVSPSVVSISVAYRSLPDDEQALRGPALHGQALEAALAERARTAGTGFCIDRDGYILTSEHVISGAQSIWVTTDNGRVFPAMVVGSDPRQDIAVLKVPVQLQPVEVSDKPTRRGQWALVLGNPVGLATAGDLCLSVGVVSATERALPRLSTRENRDYHNLIQMTAEVNPGNSGGPVMGLDGKVIGMVAAVVLPQKVTDGIGFALPLDESLLAKIADLKAGRSVRYGFLGVSVMEPTEVQRVAGRVDNGGVVVTDVGLRTPADGSLRVGDLVTRFGDHAVAGAEEFMGMVGSAVPDVPVVVEFRRGGELLAATVLPSERLMPGPAVSRDTQRLRWRGMMLGMAPDGVVRVIDIDPSDPRLPTDIRPGQIIHSIAGTTVRDLPMLQTLLHITPDEQLTIDPELVAMDR